MFEASDFMVEMDALNEGTRMVSLPWRGGVAPDSFHQLFLRHYPVLRQVCNAAPANGFAAFAIYANHLVADVVTLGAGAAVVAGRHTRAQLHMAHDPSVALRHILLRGVQHDGRTLLRMMDLNTGQGFRLDGFGSCAALLVEGDVCVTVGSFAILVFALDGKPWPESADEAWASRPRGPVLDTRVPGDERLPLPRQRSGDTSSITVVSGPVMLSSDGAGFARAATLRPMGRLGSRSYAMSREHLERGVLLGRYSRCDLATRGMWHNDGVSRVHLLIMREGDHIVAIDLASSNGTLINGTYQAVATLESVAMLELGEGNVVRWDHVSEPLAHAM